jgi:hypothetical protein
VRGRPARSATADILEPLPRLVFPTPGPLLGDHRGAIDEAFAQIELSPVSQMRRQGNQDLLERARADPFLESAVAGLVRKGLPEAV